MNPAKLLASAALVLVQLGCAPAFADAASVAASEQSLLAKATRHGPRRAWRR